MIGVDPTPEQIVSGPAHSLVSTLLTIAQQSLVVIVPLLAVLIGFVLFRKIANMTVPNDWASGLDGDDRGHVEPSEY